MGFWDFLTGGGGSDDEENTGPYPKLQEMENTEIARQIAESDLRDRNDLLLDDRFLLHHWTEIKEAISSNEELQAQYGLNKEDLIYMKDGRCICSEHEVPIEMREYGDEVRTTDTHETTSQAKANVDMGIPGASMGGEISGGGSKQQSQTIIDRSSKVEVCKLKPSNCTVSLYFFYLEASHSRPMGRKQLADEILTS